MEAGLEGAHLRMLELKQQLWDCSVWRHMAEVEIERLTLKGKECGAELEQRVAELLQSKAEAQALR